VYAAPEAAARAGSTDQADRTMTTQQASGGSGFQTARFVSLDVRTPQPRDDSPASGAVTASAFTPCGADGNLSVASLNTGPLAADTPPPSFATAGGLKALAPLQRSRTLTNLFSGEHSGVR
jgi:hypothetical protein